MFRTTRQRRVLCRGCPVAQVANVLGDSCTLLILRDLLDSPRRFGELERSLSGVSSRTLAKKLKFLEKEGFIRQTASRSHPPHIEYTLTKKGAGLRTIIGAMRRYGAKFL